MTVELRGRVLHAGHVQGRSLRLDEPLSFWGGFDPSTGVVIDQSHPQVGQSLTDRIVLVPGSRGSAGTPGVVAESLRAGTGPLALIVTKADINLTAGVLVAASLYDIECPLILVDETDLARMPNDADVEITSSGRIRGSDS